MKYPWSPVDFSQINLSHAQRLDFYEVWLLLAFSSLAYTLFYLTLWSPVTMTILEFLQHLMLPSATGPLYMLD